MNLEDRIYAAMGGRASTSGKVRVHMRRVAKQIAAMKVKEAKPLPRPPDPPCQHCHQPWSAHAQVEGHLRGTVYVCPTARFSGKMV